MIDKKQFVMSLYPFNAGPDQKYYMDMGSNSYHMYVLGNLLSDLRREYVTRENIINTLNTKNFICIAGDLDCFYAYFDSQTNMLKVGGEYDDYQDQAYFEKSFPQEKSKDFLEYEYPISLDNFLELAEKMKRFFDDSVEWIILYEDEQGKVHLEKYDKKIDYL